MGESVVVPRDAQFQTSQCGRCNEEREMSGILDTVMSLNWAQIDAFDLEHRVSLCVCVCYGGGGAAKVYYVILIPYIPVVYIVAVQLPAYMWLELALWASYSGFVSDNFRKSGCIHWQPVPGGR